LFLCRAFLAVLAPQFGQLPNLASCLKLFPYFSNRGVGHAEDFRHPVVRDLGVLFEVSSDNLTLLVLGQMAATGLIGFQGELIFLLLICKMADNRRARNAQFYGY